MKEEATGKRRFLIDIPLSIIIISHMLRHSDYVPLHVHTEYSLLDGAIMIDELIEAASAMRMPACAITDHGNLFGAVEFYRKATKAGIKPIIGCEVYVAPKSRFEKVKSEAEEVSFHLILLAKNTDGYKNLVTLASKAYTEGFYYKPRIDMELLEQHSGGLIALTSCMKGQVPYYLLRDMPERAGDVALRYKQILGADNFYIEVQSNGLPRQEELNKKLFSLADEHRIGVVATNDCHYLKKEDAKAHDILLCIQTGKIVTDSARLKMDSEELYFKSPEEMKTAFGDRPDAIANTIKIAEMCNFEFNLGASLLPRYMPPEGLSPLGFLEKLAHEGLDERVGRKPPHNYIERLRHELSVIKKMGFESYFLIVWDFVNFAKKKGIPVGPGRGSAAGSLVSYSLGITEIDPIKYNLLFERFLNPERISMPDIDMDFCKDRRPEVISYVSEKYGHDHVAQIITFGTMAAKASIRDVGRALDIPYQDVDRIAKLVPNTLNITIDEALRLEPQLKESYDSSPTVKELLDIARRLEGLSRHASTHAAGVVISPAPLTELTPLYRNPTDGSITTQFDMGSIEKLGLIKFDLLGLKTLTLIEKSLGFINKDSRAAFSLKEIPLDDEPTYRLLRSGQTTGVFQLESAGMKDLLVKMSPGRFEDLIALVALYRPGPIGSGMIDNFIKGKKGEITVKYLLPELKNILDETYGVILYQEQVMSIANRIAGFSMGQADILRKAMGKKKPEEMEKQKEAFIKGAIQNRVPEGKAEKLFSLMAMFAEYGFNKSHSAAYAYLSYQTAYLKAHYPVEFMAATLSSDIDSTDKIVKSIKELRNMSIEILPPDINYSGREFKVSGNSIRFGLEAVKGVGGSAMESIIEVREKYGRFASFEDFLEKADTKKVNKKVIEALIKAGAFDSLSPDSLPGISRALAMETLNLPNASAPSLGLFGDREETGKTAEWDETELLRYEKEALGFYISGNPLTRYRHVTAAMNIKGTAELEHMDDRQEAEVAGILHSIKRLKTRVNAEIMANLSLEDDEGSVEVIVFPELYKSNVAILKKDTLLLIKGTIDRTEKGSKLIAKEISNLEDFIKNKTNGEKVEISIRQSSGIDLRLLKEVIQPYSGSQGSPLYLRFLLDGTETLIITGFKVEPKGAMVEKIEGLLGKGAVRII